MRPVTERRDMDESFEDAFMKEWEWPDYEIGEEDLKQIEENASFEELARQELAEQRRDNFLRQERRNVSLRARGNNHYRKVHCAKIKARKGWR